MAERKLHIVDGWATDDPSEYELYKRGAEGWTYWSQIGVDARSWKPWAFWLMGVLSIIHGTLSHDWRSQLIGAGILATYVHMLRKVMTGRRKARLLTVTVPHFTSTHPLMSNMLFGEFEDSVSKERGRAMCPAWAVEQLRRPDGSLEVLVAHSPGDEYSFVVGLRPREMEASPRDETIPAPAAALEAHCSKHPEHRAAGTCSRCGGFACEECLRSADGKTYCYACSFLLVAPAGVRLYLATACAFVFIPLQLGFLAAPPEARSQLGLFVAAFPLVGLFLVGSEQRARSKEGFMRAPPLRNLCLVLVIIDFGVSILLSPLLEFARAFLRIRS